MKIDPLALILYLVLAFLILTLPGSAQQANVISSCGSVTLTAGSTVPWIMNTGGSLCIGF